MKMNLGKTREIEKRVSKKAATIIKCSGLKRVEF